MQHYQLIKQQGDDILGCWEGKINQFTHVFGFSKLGHVFLYSKDTNEYGVLHPMKQALKSYGEFESVQEFESEILHDPDFIDYVFQPDHVSAIAEHAGGLGENEIYVPCPYPFLGGSEEPDTYMKGNVWVFLDLAGQTYGI